MRTRRTREEAERVILEAAEHLLIEGGPLAVQVRAVAQRVSMTDAGVNHHFGNRDQLLVALLRHGGDRLRRAVEDAVGTWTASGADIDALVDAIAAIYRDRYSELAVALHAAGWRDRGGGMLEPLVDALQAARTSRDPSADINETRIAVAALHQALATEPVYGLAFRRSAGIPAAEAKRSQDQLQWWSKAIRATLRC